MNSESRFNKIDETLNSIQKSLQELREQSIKTQSTLDLHVLPTLVKNQEDITNGLVSTRKELRECTEDIKTESNKKFKVTWVALGFIGLFLLIIHGQAVIDYIKSIIIQ